MCAVSCGLPTAGDRWEASARKRGYLMGMRRTWSGALPFAAVASFVALVVVGCASPDSDGATLSPTEQVGDDRAPLAVTPSAAADDSIAEPAASADVPPLSDEAITAIDAYVERLAARIYDPVNDVDPAVIERLGELDDERLAWLVADGLRFIGRGPELDALVEAGSKLGGIDLEAPTAWLSLNNHLIRSDRPAPPGYERWKREIYIAVDATWAPFFDDADAEVDWRLVTFGGVLADRRPFGSDDTCQCIAALDDPPAEPAEAIDWLDDRDIVIGLVVDGEARAYPLHIMEQHELVNDVLGGERVSLAYCTLCGSGQAYRLDALPADARPAVLRTSGLLYRSNKLMFDLTSRSLIETFTGEAWTGPWREAGIVLEQIPTVTSQWGAWRAEHPNTTLMTGKNGTGPDYPIDPLGDRDDGGPIFPVGEVDPRLFPQTTVLGVTTTDGRFIAFPVFDARDALRADQTVELAGVSVSSTGSGLRAVDRSGRELLAHEAYWFAWSQFHPETLLWEPPEG